MLGTFFISPILDPVVAWGDLPYISFIRAFFWLVGLLLLPGMYILRLTKIGHSMGKVLRLVLSLDISIALVGLLAIALYSTTKWLGPLPILSLAIIIAMATANWVRVWRSQPESKQPKSNQPESKPNPLKSLSKSHLLLLTGVAATVLVAVLVQLNWLYLFPVDLWQTLLSSTTILSQGSLYTAYTIAHYPVAFGYIMAGLSTAAGFPLVNTYVLLTPLVALNILTFYALVKVVFGFEVRTAALASVIYGFAGGLGLWAQLFAYGGTGNFLIVSSSTQDMYFFSFFWNSVEFSYKLLALTFALSSLIVFALSEKFQRYSKIFLLFLSSIFMLYAFFIHELPALLAPVLVGMVIFAGKKYDALKRMLILIVITLAAFFIMDFAMEGIYTTIIFKELSGVLGRLGTTYLLNVATVGICAIAGLCAIVGFCTIAGFTPIMARRKPSPKRPTRVSKQPTKTLWYDLSKFKLIIIIPLALIYVAGIFFWTPTATSLGYSVPFAWYHFVTRYGFVGIFALIGMAAISWKDSWFRLSAFWGLYAIVLGSIWWGERTNAYLFPPLAALAAVGIVKLWEKARSNQGLLPKLRRVSRALSIVVPPLLIAMVALSFASTAYGAYWMITEPAPAQYDKNNEVMALDWMYDNTPQNASFFTNYGFEDVLGIAGIADRGFVLSDSLPNMPLAQMFTLFPQYLDSHPKLSYIFTDPVFSQPPFITYLVMYSKTVFSSGGYSIQEIPPIKPPANQSSVVVLDRSPMGIQSYRNSFGWVDDSFISGWSYANINASTDGDVLSLIKSSAQATSTGDPLATCSVPNVSTNADPFLVIRYSNAAGTSASLSEAIQPVLSVKLAQGSNTTWTNYTLVSNPVDYRAIGIKLPANMTVEGLAIQIPNLNAQNGYYRMDIDYIGLASNPTFVATDYVRFLAMAIPSLWSTNYTIVTDTSALQNASTIITALSGDPTYLLTNISASSLVLLNATASVPSWGDDWVYHSGGIVSGSLDGKNVMIVGVNSPQVLGNLTGVSADLYKSIYG